jgi:hypothetical protein
MKHKTRDVLPVGPLAICIEQPKVRDKVLLVVPGQDCCIRCGIGDRRIKQRLLHFALFQNVTVKPGEPMIQLRHFCVRSSYTKHKHMTL